MTWLLALGLACGAPEGGVCTAKVTVYNQPACGLGEEASFSVDSMDPDCHDLNAGVLLASKLADRVWHTPGVCESSGGEPTGPVELVGPGTFCCQE